MDSKKPKQGQSRLLSLPPELRNPNYRYALVGTPSVKIKNRTHVPEPPALLQTCRQVRAEAHGIYFLKNDFIFYVKNCDASLYIHWCKTFDGIRTNGSHGFELSKSVK